jgi:hypothetical protein
MIRKSVFWGLTLVLVVALVSLIVRGRKFEKQQQAARSAEFVQPSKPTSTRVLTPTDLEVVNPTMPLPPGHAAMPEIEIRNNGNVAYSRIELKFIYLDTAGKTLTTKMHSVDRILGPGKSIKVTDMPSQEIPASAAKFQAYVLYADMED